jgi:nicotinamide riboside kinase
MKRNPYDYYLITNNDVAWAPDPQRLNKFPREQIFEMNKEAVLLEKVPFGIVQGTGDLRILNAKNQLRFFQNDQSL